MTIIFTGSGKQSWTMRGEQLGAAMGAIVSKDILPKIVTADDIVIGVKRISDGLLAEIKRSRAYFIWDIVDAYPQRERWSKDNAMLWFAREYNRLRPNAILWPNQRMYEDCEAIGIGGIVLPHHAMLNAPVNPIREKARIVGYQGSGRYIEGAVSAEIKRVCKAHNLIFNDQCANLADADIILALRGNKWDSYPIQHWKPATKLNNAHATQTPFIGNPETGYTEISTGAEIFIEDVVELNGAIESLLPFDERKRIYDTFAGTAYTIEHAVRDLRAFISSL